jgi:hypothetical protein
MASITVHGKTIHGGVFYNKDDAIAARKKLEQKHFTTELNI